MRRLFLLLIAVCFTSSLFANKEEIIYQGPYEIGDWGTVELSSIKFHNLEMGDTIYVYVSKADSTSKGAFQGHEWNTLPGIINGQEITGDYEFVVKNQDVLDELREYGLKVRGENYVIDKRLAIPSGMKQMDKAYIIFQSPGSLTLTNAEVITAVQAGTRGISQDSRGISISGSNSFRPDGSRSADDDAWYTLSGQRIDYPTAKGVYIHNGKTVVVHE